MMELALCKCYSGSQCMPGLVLGPGMEKWMAPHCPALLLELVAGAGSCPACTPPPPQLNQEVGYIKYI